eukprot:GHUV01016114.1.p1 GENE.GHUV01016114.1~~GHUV01016114.1.p1  ORF type:complete len:198 (+),score=26.86 GHUV01016114.1:98-691(+)
MLLMKQSTRPCGRVCVVRCSNEPSQHRPVQQQQQRSRRRLLGSAIMVPILLGEYYATKKAAANVIEDLERQLPDLQAPQQPAELPKAYQRTMHKLVKALRTSIEAEAAGAKEFEVRRKADGAKDLVREFVKTWQDNAAVAGDVTHNEMRVAISELGRFYQKNGPRSRLDASTKDSILGHLAAVEAALPPEEKSLIGL